MACCFNANQVPNGDILRPYRWLSAHPRRTIRIPRLDKDVGSVDLSLGSNQRTGRARELEPRHVPGMHEVVAAMAGWNAVMTFELCQ